MGLATQIIDDTLGPGQVVTAVDNPVFFHQGIEGLVDFIGSGDPVKFSSGLRRLQGADHLASKDLWQGSYREQVGAFSRVPLVLLAHCTTGDQAVQMNMPAQVLSPGRQYGGDVYGCTNAAMAGCQGAAIPC